jgi:uncharacterized protein (DUF952 family)
MIFHLAEPADWAAVVNDEYQPAAFAAEGFIHLSSEAQLIGTFNRYYSARKDLVRLTVDEAHPVVASSLVWESLVGGQEFPHLYARLPISAVMNIEPDWVPPAASPADA